MPFPRPTAADLADARNRTVPDVIAPNLQVLFVGINPGLYSGATRRHFARPGNRFWPALFKSGLTPRLFSPFESEELLEHGIGIINIIRRTTASETELKAAEFPAGLKALRRLVRKYRPRAVAFLGMGAFRRAFGTKHFVCGKQAELFEGAQLWVLPNPSGLNANYQLPELARMFREVLNGENRRGRASQVIGFDGPTLTPALSLKWRGSKTARRKRRG